MQPFDTLDDVELSADEFTAQFQEMMAELMDGDSIMEMVAGMTPRELAAMPPFPFPRNRHSPFPPFTNAPFLSFK